MAEDERRREEASKEADAEQNDLPGRFPDLPPAPEIPEPPKLSHLIPPHVTRRQPGTVEPGSYNKMALATTAASSFIMPILVLSVGGWWLDKKLHTSPWLAFGGVVIGFIAGIVSLLNVIRRLEEPPHR
jgi:hypothetical protein